MALPVFKIGRSPLTRGGWVRLPGASATTLVITGTLEYQACDGKICYNPVPVPLSWKVAMGSLVPGGPRLVRG